MTPPARPDRIGVFGGTFDPIHLAHLVIAQEALTRLHLDRVLFVPTGHPPHKPHQYISPPGQRRAMVERAVAEDSRFALSTVELDRPGPSYTVDTLAELRATWNGPIELFLILGGDMVHDLPQWHDPAGIVRQVAGIIAIQRPGFAFTPDVLEHLERQVAGLSTRLLPIEAPQLAISATMIRRRVARFLPVRYLVPDAVADYIEAQGLYRHTSDDAAPEKEGEP
jgi:nicotinate-nucleotide adenylyltransferase